MHGQVRVLVKEQSLKSPPFRLDREVEYWHGDVRVVREYPDLRPRHCASLTSAIHTKVKSSLIMRLSCGNTLKSIRGAAPFGCGANQAFPQVIRSARSR